MRISFAATLIFITSVFWSESGFGQEHKINHGLQFGLTSSNLVSNGNALFPNRQEQFFFGYYRESRFLGLLKFKAGLQFLQTGSVEKDLKEIKLSYLTLPVAIKLKIGPFYGEGGVSGAIRVAADEFQNGQKIDTNGKYDTWDAGYFFSLGAELLIFFVEYRQYWGRVGITEGYFNKYWQLGGGIRF